MTDDPKFNQWWDEHGQFVRSGGGQYEISFAWAAWQAARATAEQSAKLQAVNDAGSKMSNIFFNLAQRPGEPISADMCAVLDTCRKEWDEAIRALKSQQDAAIPFRPHHEILDALKTDPKLLADIEQAVAASKQSIAQLERERTVTREQLNTPLCQAAGDYDVEALMDRWGIPSHLRDRFRGPMRKLVVCKQQDAAIESKPAEQPDPIRALIAVHAEQLDQNDYAYFELAYTRHTAWMAWLCSNSRDDDPNRKVLAKGQGHTPEEACAAAVESQRSGDGS